MNIRSKFRSCSTCGHEIHEQSSTRPVRGEKYAVEAWEEIPHNCNDVRFEKLNERVAELEKRLEELKKVPKLQSPDFWDSGKSSF